MEIDSDYDWEPAKSIYGHMRSDDRNDDSKGLKPVQAAEVVGSLAVDEIDSEDKCNDDRPRRNVSQIAQAVAPPNQRPRGRPRTKPQAEAIFSTQVDHAPLARKVVDLCFGAGPLHSQCSAANQLAMGRSTLLRLIWTVGLARLRTWKQSLCDLVTAAVRASIAAQPQS